MQQTIHASRPQEVAVTTSESTTGKIDYREHNAGEIQIPAGSSITTLTWWTSYDGETWLAAYDGASTPVAQAQGNLAASRTYPIPSALAGAAFIKAVGNAAGTIYVNLKS